MKNFKNFHVARVLLGITISLGFFLTHIAPSLAVASDREAQIPQPPFLERT